MVLFACPPLPIELARDDAKTVANSHDFVAFLIDVAMRIDNSDMNEKRRLLQVDLINSLFDDNVAVAEIDELERRLQGFTRAWMMGYHENMHGMVFLPLDCATIKIRRQVESWLAAQFHLLGEEKDVGDFVSMSIHDLYKLCFATKARVHSLKIWTNGVCAADEKNK